jgi:hypothetical protein
VGNRGDALIVMLTGPRIAMIAVGIAAVPHTVPAQSPTTWVVAPRYGSAGEAALFAARIAPHWVVGEELTIAVHSGDKALAVAAGPRLTSSAVSVIIIAGPVIASGSWYAGLYFAPAVHVGQVAATGTLEFFIPATTGARFVYEVSHARLLVRVGSGWQGGAFFHLVKSAGDAAQRELGASLRLRIKPDLTVTADAARGLGGTPSEVILSMQWER